MIVSLIIPVFQVSEYIDRCIQSVMNQSYKDIECIIVDDATQDDSIIKCERLISDYNGPIQFRIVHHERNKGLSMARNTGTSIAKGEYIYYLDSDDEISPCCIESLVSIVHDNPQIDMVIGNHQRRSLDGEVFDDFPYLKEGLYNHQETYTMFLEHRLPEYAVNKLLKRSFLDQNRITFCEGIMYEDKLWMFFIVKGLRSMYVSKCITYYYYFRPNSLLTSAKREFEGKSLSVIYSEIINNLTPKSETLELKRYVGGFCSNYLEFNHTITRYKVLLKDYLHASWKYRSVGPLSKLFLTIVLSVFPNGLAIMRWLSNARK